jgi:hypothetical protein
MSLIKDPTSSLASTARPKHGTDCSGQFIASNRTTGKSTA